MRSDECDMTNRGEETLCGDLIVSTKCGHGRKARGSRSRRYMCSLACMIIRYLQVSSWLNVGAVDEEWFRCLRSDSHSVHACLDQEVLTHVDQAPNDFEPQAQVSSWSDNLNHVCGISRVVYIW